MLRITSSLRSTQPCFMQRKLSSVVERARKGIRDSVIKTPTKEVSIQQNSVVRYGAGDGCITLNVGGKEFQTLRSTVFSNQVLAKHVVRAEGNQEITKNGAVFIDRDPEQFGFILRYLRNQMEQLEAKSQHATTRDLLKMDKAKAAKLFMKKMSASHTRVALPHDDKVLRELYVEASFYEIPELQAKLASCTFGSRLVNMFNKDSANPLAAGAKLVGRIRNLLLAMGAAGTTTMLWIQSELDLVLTRFGLRKDEAPQIEH